MEFVTVYVLYIGIDNSSQGPTLAQWPMECKVERDENYVWIYYNSNFLDLDLLFTYAYIMMIKIYVTIYLEREKKLNSLVLFVVWVKEDVSQAL